MPPLFGEDQMPLTNLEPKKLSFSRSTGINSIKHQKAEAPDWI